MFETALTFCFRLKIDEKEMQMTFKQFFRVCLYNYLSAWLSYDYKTQYLLENMHSRFWFIVHGLKDKKPLIACRFIRVFSCSWFAVIRCIHPGTAIKKCSNLRVGLNCNSSQ